MIIYRRFKTDGKTSVYMLNAISMLFYIKGLSIVESDILNGS